MSLGVGAVSRAVTSITEEPIQAHDARQAMLAYDTLGEVTQQCQVPISGKSGEGEMWTQRVVAFDVEFVLDATDQRTSSLTDPHFTFGVVCDQPVGVHVVVLEYLRRGDVIAGARIAIGVTSTPSVLVTTTEDPLANGALQDPDVSAAEDGPPTTITTTHVTVDDSQRVEFNGAVHLSFQGFGAPAESGADLDADG